MDRRSLLQDVTLALPSACDTQLGLMNVKHTLLRASEISEDEWDEESTLDPLIAHELLSTMRTCAMALEQISAEMRMGIFNPLQRTLKNLTEGEKSDGRP